MERIEIKQNNEDYKRSKLQREALAAYESTSFEESSTIMAELAMNILGEEAADSLGLTDQNQRNKLKSIFHDAALAIGNKFKNSFNQNGEFLPEQSDSFWLACDAEGPIAKDMVGKAAEAIGLSLKPADIKNLQENVYVEDTIKLILEGLKTNNIISAQQAIDIEQDILALCANPKQARDLFAKVVPPTDYYYSRIFREKKENNESILKFNDGQPHNTNDLQLINLSLRLANATWLAAQRHSAKKDGTTDRINPDKRNGVFNTPDYRNIEQFKQALHEGCNPNEAIIRVAFELSKDSWMLED